MHVWRFSVLFGVGFFVGGYLIAIVIALLFPPDVMLQLVPLITILIPSAALLSERLLKLGFVGYQNTAKTGYGKLLLHATLTSIVSLACLAGLIVWGIATPVEVLVSGSIVVTIVCALFAKLLLKSG